MLRCYLPIFIFYIFFSAAETRANGPLCSHLFNLVVKTELFDLKPLSRGHFSARLKSGEPIFLKRMRQGGEREYEWLLSLNKLKLGVQTHGLYKIENQSYLILSFVEGTNTQMPILAPAGFRLTKSMQAEIQRQALILADASIIPIDLQFQISDKGQVILIDPELFRKASTPAEAHQQTKMILNQLFSVWALEDKMD